MSSKGPSKRPRLSIETGPPGLRAARLAAVTDPRDATSFNTLRNVYVAATDREPLSPPTAGRGRPGVQTPYAPACPATPLTARPPSPTTPVDAPLPAIMAATPPLSAGPTVTRPPPFGLSPSRPDADDTGEVPRATPAIVVSHAAVAAAALSPARSGSRRRGTLSVSLGKPPPPYTHPRSLHSILRNSPLPPRGSRSPASPRRQSLRLQERAARRVSYHSPLTQTIQTSKYTKAHVDLLAEDSSPCADADADADTESPLDRALADATRDGGHTPGPFEDMRRRMAGLGAANPMSPANGVRKRRARRDRRRSWTWTIGVDDDSPGTPALPPTMADVLMDTGGAAPIPTAQTEDQDRMDMDADVSD